MTLRESSAYHIQNLIDLDPDCQVVRLEVAEALEEDFLNIKSFFLSKVIVRSDGSIAMPMYRLSSKDMIESLSNLNKQLKEIK